MGMYFNDFSETKGVGGKHWPQELGSACIDVQRVTGEANRLPKPLGSLLTAACEIACVLPSNRAQLAKGSSRTGEEGSRE